MPIKNADGTPYQLKKPNPLLKTQDITGDAHIVHNFHVQEVVVKYRGRKMPTQAVGAVIGTQTPHPVLAEQPVAQGPPVQDRLMPVAPGEPYVPPVEEPPVDPPIPADPVDNEDDHYLDDQDEATQDIQSCWCLPGEFSKMFDKLYGETRQSVKWGDKFIFNGIVLDATEMNFVIWANVLIRPPSIIFMRSQRRWWRVTDVQPKDDGYAMTCLPSDTRPRFD